MSLAAAGCVAALSIWLIHDDGRRESTLGAQEAAPRAKEIDEWISGLAHENVAERNRVDKSLLGLAADLAYALESLDRLQSSSEPEVRARSLALRTRLVQRAREMSGVPGSVRSGIAKVRAAWLRRQYASFEELVRTSFESVAVSYVRYVTKVEIGDHMESDNSEDYHQFKPGGRFGGSRDILTREVYQSLDNGEGIVAMEGQERVLVPKKSDDLLSLGQCLIFTLPEAAKAPEGKNRWECYVVVAFGKAGTKQ
jgi:hypothetical protein